MRVFKDLSLTPLLPPLPEVFKYKSQVDNKLPSAAPNNTMETTDLSVSKDLIMWSDPTTSSLPPDGNLPEADTSEPCLDLPVDEHKVAVERLSAASITTHQYVPSNFILSSKQRSVGDLSAKPISSRNTNLCTGVGGNGCVIYDTNKTLDQLVEID